MISRLILMICLIPVNAVYAAWECPAVDKFGYFYSVKNIFVKIAVSKSMDLCKHKSADPASCLVERAYCQRIAKSNPHNTHWQCFAYDSNGEKYPSGPYSNQYQSTLKAEYLCRRLSKLPSSCNVPLFTCEKI